MQVPDAALVDVLDERRDCVVMVRRDVERRPDGRRVVVVRRRGRVRVRQRVMVMVGRKVVIVMMVGVTVSEVSLEYDAHTDLVAYISFCTEGSVRLATGLGWLRLGGFPRLVGCYCSYLLPKQGGGT